MNKEELSQKLKLYDIDYDWYSQRQQRLIDLGYTEEQANKIIVRRSPKNTVESLIEFHSDLISFQ